MSVQLVLKNSSVQDKEATAAQLAVGELALNYHSSGPFLQCEDSAGNIWRLGGVVIASTAPSSPSRGAWWLDSDDNHLYFYAGSSWIEIQTGEIVPGDITEGTARQLLQTNAAGNGTEWTSNIDVPGTLDVTGVATFDNNVVITGNLTVNGTTTTIDTETLLVEDKNIEIGVVTTPTDLTADGGGITLKGATDKTINWVNATDAWTSSERFSVPLGAQATPSLTFTGDANTGIYSPGADQVAISTGGTGRLFVDASGRVGVGTTSPTNVLHVRGSNQQLQLQDSNTDDRFQIRMNGGWAEFLTAGSDNSARPYRFRQYTTDVLVIDSSGRVGVGTSSPSELLTVDGTALFGVGFDTASASGLGVKILKGSSYAGIQTQASSSASDTTFAYRAYKGTSKNFEVNVAGGAYFAGSVGVGTTSPSAFLHVQNDTTANTYAYIQNTTTGNAGVHIQNSAGNWQIIANANLRFRDQGNTTDRMVIDSSGRVGIGTSSPSQLLHIRANSAVAGIRLESAGGSGKTYEIRSLTNGLLTVGTTTQNILNISGNNVGIGTTSPDERLVVSGGCVLVTGFLSSVDRPSSSVMDFLNGATRFFSIGADSSTHGQFVFNTSTTTTVSERARIDTSGRLLVGTSSAPSGHIGTYSHQIIKGNSTNANGALGLIRNAANPAVNTGLGHIFFGDANGAQGAGIQGVADGAWATNDYPSRLVFSTTADGASSPTERVRIESTGKTKFSGATYGVENTITASAFNLNNGNLWTCGAIAIPNPTNAVAGLMGSIRVTAAPTSFGSNFDHPGGSYTAPTSFPAVAPFYCVSSTNILLGSWTQGIA